MLVPLHRVIATINSAGAAQGAETLMSMPPSRVEAVMTEMSPAEVARLLHGARAERKPDLLAAIGPVRLPFVLSRMPRHQVLDLISSLPLRAAVLLLRGMSSSAASELIMELPSQYRIMMQGVFAPAHVPGAENADYHRLAEESVRRIASRLSWLDQGVGDLLAEVLGRPFQIAVRYRADEHFGGDDLRELAGRVDWRRVVAVVVLTNGLPGDTVSAVVRELRQYGHAADVMRWADENDDGTLKRILMRLIS